MSYEYKLKSILLFNHIMLIVGLVYANPNWLWLSLVGWFIFGRVGGEIGLHRYLSHNSFKTGPLRRKFLIIISIFNCFGSPIHWCGIHRKHHKVSDAEGDPHGYQSMWRIWTTFWKPFVVERKYVADLVRDPFIKLIHKNYLKILINFIFVALIFSYLFIQFASILEYPLSTRPESITSFSAIDLDFFTCSDSFILVVSPFLRRCTPFIHTSETDLGLVQKTIC